jgi:hypothetical protein
MNNTIDEFGGDFLADFDVDAAVRARNTTPNETNNDSNKRQKTDRDPFSENSPFTRGYTTNPIHELSSTIPPSQQQQEAKDGSRSLFGKFSLYQGLHDESNP